MNSQYEIDHKSEWQRKKSFALQTDKSYAKHNTKLVERASAYTSRMYIKFVHVTSFDDIQGRLKNTHFAIIISITAHRCLFSMLSICVAFLAAGEIIDIIHVENWQDPIGFVII